MNKLAHAVVINTCIIAINATQYTHQNVNEGSCCMMSILTGLVCHNVALLMLLDAECV